MSTPDRKAFNVVEFVVALIAALIIGCLLLPWMATEGAEVGLLKWLVLVSFMLVAPLLVIGLGIAMLVGDRPVISWGISVGMTFIALSSLYPVVL